MFDYGGFEGLFNAHLSADVYAKVYGEIKLLYATLFSGEKEIFRKNLFDLAYNAPNPEPTLGRVTGGVLYLNAGPHCGGSEIH